MNTQYTSAVEHLEDEARLLRLVCKRIAAEANGEADRPRAGHLSVVGQNPCCRESAREAEDRLRAEIAARLRASREAGAAVSVDAVANDHDLDQLERTVLTVAVLEAVGEADALNDLPSTGYAGCNLTPAVLADLLQLDLETRLRLRKVLGPRGRLLVGGLVEVEMVRDGLPEDWRQATVIATWKVFARVFDLDVADLVEDED